VILGMMDAGAPCPKDGLFGAAAKAAWEVAENPEPRAEEAEKKELTSDEKTLMGAGGVLVLLAALLL